MLEGVINPRAAVRANVVVGLVLTSGGTELVSVLHDAVDEEGAVDAGGVVHAFGAAAVTLFFVVVGLAERAKFNGKVYGQDRNRGWETYSW